MILWSIITYSPLSLTRLHPESHPRNSFRRYTRLYDIFHRVAGRTRQNAAKIPLKYKLRETRRWKFRWKYGACASVFEIFMRKSTKQARIFHIGKSCVTPAVHKIIIFASHCAGLCLCSIEQFWHLRGITRISYDIWWIKAKAQQRRQFEIRR